MSEHILTYLEDKAHGRRNRWHTTEIAVLPDPLDLLEPCIVSRYARCGIVTRRRFIRNDILVSVNGCFDTPSSVARDYLMLKYHYGPKWTTTQREIVLAEISGAPLYAAPCSFEDGAYIDLRAAYWSVMTRVGWDVNYYPGRWLCVEDPPLDFPWAYDKRSRNSLVSVARATQVTMWRPPNNYTQETRPNPRPNSQLYCLIMDCLNGIAAEAIAEGAVYVFTDGYISPDNRTTQRIVKRIHDWGFDCSIKGHGRGTVYGIGSYRVGSYRSKIPTEHPADFRSIKELKYKTWLKDKMQFATITAPWHRPFVQQEDRRDRYGVG